MRAGKAHTVRYRNATKDIGGEGGGEGVQVMLIMRGERR